MTLCAANIVVETQMCYCGMETAQIGDLCSAGDLNGVITPKCSDNNDVCIMIGAEMKDCEEIGRAHV